MKRILVIDDDHMLRTSLCELFAFLEYDTLEAADGMQGLTLIQTNRPDLIISDLEMPVMTGHALKTELDKSPETAYIPFILLTGCQHTTITTTATSKQMSKPFDLGDLLATVTEMLNEHATCSHATASS